MEGNALLLIPTTSARVRRLSMVQLASKTSTNVPKLLPRALTVVYVLMRLDPTTAAALKSILASTVRLHTCRVARHPARMEEHVFKREKLPTTAAACQVLWATTVSTTSTIVRATAAKTVASVWTA